MRAFVALTVLATLILTTLPGVPSPAILQPHPILSLVSSQHTELESTLSWLVANAYSNGSYGQYYEGQAAAAAYALWLNDSGSHNAASSYAYLAGQLNDSKSWFWGSFGEADVPGEVLFSIALGQHLNLIQNLPEISSRLLQFQQPNGGFEGFYGVPSTSVDTAMALWGLSIAGTIPPENRTSAVNYLLTLQNPDGSFSLASTITADPLSSLGPDPTSITALVILVLRDNGFNLGNPSILKALGFLAKAASNGFNGPGHIYAASLSILSFLQYDQPREAASALAYLRAQQNSDGGFADIIRSTPASNALDTGWAAVALQFGIIEGATTGGPVNRPPTARFSFNPEEPRNGTTVSFDAGSSMDSDGDSLSFAWTFGDGGSASGPVVTHVYTTSGVYTATLTVMDSGVNPEALLNTSWLNVTVQQSKAPARAAPSPSTPTSSAVIILALLAVAIVTVYLVVRSSKRKLVPKITVASPRPGAVFEA